MPGVRPVQRGGSGRQRRPGGLAPAKTYSVSHNKREVVGSGGVGGAKPVLRSWGGGWSFVTDGVVGWGVGP